MIRLKVLGGLLTVGVLSFSTGLFAYLYFTKEKPQVSTIIVTERGTRILTPSDKNIREQETINFLKEFSKYYFNYDSTNVTEQIGEGSGFLTTTLWDEQEEKKYFDLLKITKSTKLIEVSRLRKIHSPDDDKFKYTLYFDTKLTKNGKTQNLKTEVDIRLKDVERGEDSIWGLKIDELTKRIL